MGDPKLGEELESAGLKECIDLEHVGSEVAKSQLVFLTKDKTYYFLDYRRTCVLVNGRNHIRVVVRVVENDLKQAYEKLAEVHSLIGAKAKLAFDSRAGFLVSSPQELGTGGFKLTIEENGKERVVEAKFGASVKDTIDLLISEFTATDS